MCHIMVARALSQRVAAQRRLGQPAAEAGENCCCLLLLHVTVPVVSSSSSFGLCWQLK
jgi:hypothetical protein